MNVLLPRDETGSSYLQGVNSASETHGALKCGDSFGFPFAPVNVSFLDSRAARRPRGERDAVQPHHGPLRRFGAKWKTEFPLDCLHYCYPGPADYWALALYNLMLNNPRFRAL